MLTRLCSCCLFLFFSVSAYCQSSYHFGLHYSYGAQFNLHHLNHELLRPSDGSAMGAFFQLDNGTRALGFRCTLSWKIGEAHFRIQDNTYVNNTQRSVELKLQCTLPVSERSTFALGIAPRVVVNSQFRLEYANDVNNMHHSEQRTLNGVASELNALNTSLAFSWYYRFAKRWSFALNLDQDMLSSFQDDVVFPAKLGDIIFPEAFSFNSRMTTLSASIVFSVR